MSPPSLCFLVSRRGAVDTLVAYPVAAAAPPSGSKCRSAWIWGPGFLGWARGPGSQSVCWEGSGVQAIDRPADPCFSLTPFSSVAA